MSDRATVVTIVKGRHDHLREQRRVLRSLAPGTPHVVVAMGDAAIDAVVGPDDRTTVVHVDDDPRGLPLAKARNTGVQTALAAGAELVVLLDVDCVPGPGLVDAYRRAAERAPDALLAGPVTYLREGVRVPEDPHDLTALRAPHAARPDPPPGELVRGGDHDLFWSLSCAVTASTWRTLGGFHEGYVGYGAEDTDLGRVARARGVDLVWVGGADAYHQFHPVSHPPVGHLEDIVRNATTFHERWGEWPMRGWLDEFERRGLLRLEGSRLIVLPDRAGGGGA
ncbi:glycosyltransferase family 2 protein [Knoellia aerolata]|uniref:Sugar transferase n=1 Tax=Knoellia aerolata DSM 18566 TaxID=1385519 RepID=A0A0A0K1P9_9MICO|nr:galactosyltransferase-related protein [Knoellia aerolata]KGN42257.1 sugar transferase [Knoellia aerolata DSM 18566]